MADHCCNEHGCTRKQPILLRPSGLIPDCWYVVTRYTRTERDGQPDLIEASVKHELDDQTSVKLSRWRDAVGILAELVRLHDMPEADRAAEAMTWESARLVLGSRDG